MIALSVDVEPDFPPHYESLDGLGEGLTALVADIREANADATFFVTGELLDKKPEVLDLLKGFEIGCHGFRHIDLTELRDLQVYHELVEAMEAFNEHGIKPSGFRAPYARVNNMVLDSVRRIFEYDSSVVFYHKQPHVIEEAPIYSGGKLFGFSNSWFNRIRHFPRPENKVFFIHPWEYGGFDFSKIMEKRRDQLKWGYAKENYRTNLKELLKEKTVRISELIKAKK
ncbi:Polysaccharide deacetylase [uncultured archaeon]|nr:Polysaccharide deacetylase [uncultured archaeon]